MIILTFDTETTGFPTESYKPELVQIAAILQDDTPGIERTISEISLIVAPKNDIPESAQSIHHISTYTAQMYGVDPDTADDVFSALLERCDILVAHNIEFDLQIMKLNLPGTTAMLDNESSLQYFDTMHALTPILKLPKTGENHYHDDKYPDYKAPKLKEAYKHYFGKEFENQHDAMADVRACRDVYFAYQDARSNAGK